MGGVSRRESPFVSAACEQGRGKKRKALRVQRKGEGRGGRAAAPALYFLPHRNLPNFAYLQGFDPARHNYFIIISPPVLLKKLIRRIHFYSAAALASLFHLLFVPPPYSGSCTAHVWAEKEEEEEEGFL